MYFSKELQTKAALLPWILGGNFLCNKISISIPTFDFDFDEENKENNGESFQYLELPSDCLSEMGWEYWVLSNDYGALNLVECESGIGGLQSTYAVVSIWYANKNSGSFASNIDSANITSAFTGLQEFSTPILVGPRDELVLSSETTTLNLTSGTTLDFSLLISGVSDGTGQQICSSYALYSFCCLSGTSIQPLFSNLSYSLICYPSID